MWQNQTQATKWRRWRWGPRAHVGPCTENTRGSATRAACPQGRIGALQITGEGSQSQVSAHLYSISITHTFRIRRQLSRPADNRIGGGVLQCSSKALLATRALPPSDLSPSKTWGIQEDGHTSHRYPFESDHLVYFALNCHVLVGDALESSQKNSLEVVTWILALRVLFNP